MSTLSHKLVAACMVTAISMVMYGCGGGGGSSSDDEMTMMPPPEPEMCPEGQEGTPPNCMVPGPTAEEIAATTKAAGTKRDAIAAEAAQTAQEQLDRGLGGDDGAAPTASQVAGEYNLNIEHGKTEIVKEAAAEADNETFTQAMDLGGGTTMHVLTEDADMDGNVVEEVVMVHTDVEAPTPTAFAMVETLNANPNDASVNQSLTIDATNLGMLATDGITSVGSGQITLMGAVEDDPSTTDVDETVEAFSTSAMFRGAPGTLMCNGGASNCTATLDADGDITTVGSGWIFTPDDGATIDIPDSEYLAYGFWLQRTTDSDGAVTYNEVETFAEARGQTQTGNGTTSGITGSATYSGGALGVYVHSITNPDGTEASATSGHFTADVALTAYFNQTAENDIAPTFLNSLTGTINNFMLSGHDQGPGWSVSLEKDADTADASASGVAKGGGADGTYSATFYGGDTTDDAAPDSIVGEFNAFFSNGSVAGGFGATKDE